MQFYQTQSLHTPVLISQATVLIPLYKYLTPHKVSKGYILTFWAQKRCNITTKLIKPALEVRIAVTLPINLSFFYSALRFHVK